MLGKEPPNSAREGFIVAATPPSQSRGEDGGNATESAHADQRIERLQSEGKSQAGIYKYGSRAALRSSD